MKYLKIKDSIDLKELEKFGFEYEPLLHKYYYVYIPFLWNWFFKGFSGSVTTIHDKTKIIEVLIDCPYWKTDTLYKTKNPILNKLIKADIVECVEDE